MNILTIDFDIFMNQNIELYNYYIDETHSVESLMETNSLLRLCPFDNILYILITNYLLQLLNRLNQDDIIFVENHQEALNFLQANTNSTLINIDHHHDLGYGPSLEDEDKSGLGCANWIYYGLKNNLITNYIWIFDSNSQIQINADLHKKYNIYSIEFDDINMNELPTIDRVILCLSPNWIIPEFREYFYLWKNIVYNYYNMKGKKHETNWSTV